MLAPTSLDADDEEDATHALLRSDDLFATELAKSGAPVRPALAAPKEPLPDAPREAAVAQHDPPAEVSLTDRFSPSDLQAVRASLQPPPTRVTEPPAAPVPPPAARSISTPRPPSPMPWRPTVVASVVGIAVILAAAAAWVSLFVVRR